MVTIPVNNEITLRTYEPADADALFAVVNDNRQHLHPWLNWVAHTTKPEHSLQFIKQSIHKSTMQEGLDLGIFINGRIAGGVGMLNWDHNLKKAEIGYWVAKGHEGKGVITDSLNHFVPFLFNKLGLNKIEVRFVAPNKRSAKVAERLGCRIEGVLRQSMMRNGIAEDLVIAGILKSEWKPVNQ
jgi:ribosomal-protein-serine acetyltransferase